LALVAFVIYFKIIGMCSVLLCLHVEQRVSGSEVEGSQVIQSTENFFMLCFVSSQLGAGQGNTSPWREPKVMCLWCVRCFTKSKFQKHTLIP
jgi:hypothetical protein